MATLEFRKHSQQSQFTKTLAATQKLESISGQELGGEVKIRPPLRYLLFGIYTLNTLIQQNTVLTLCAIQTFSPHVVVTFLDDIFNL